MKPELTKWFNKIADDLDPHKQWARPEFMLDSYDFNCSYFPKVNLITMNLEFVAQKNYNVYEVIAHELRHWWQYQAGKLRRESFGSGFYWNDHYISSFYMSFIGSQEEYEQLPWEADANEYAAEVYARLFPKTGVA